MGLVLEIVYLHDVQVYMCLADAYEDYDCFDEVSFFRNVQRFNMEQRAGLSFM
jgi:hypothetical protein